MPITQLLFWAGKADDDARKLKKENDKARAELERKTKKYKR